MIVIISDLHLCDGTATQRNVSPDAFSVLFEDVYALARDYHAEQIDLVFLGDVVDLLRTERWFAVPPADRPWGSADALTDSALPTATQAQARAITADILAQNDAALRSLRGELPGLTAPCPVRRIFLPGNHDRLYLVDDVIRAQVRQALGTVDERALGSEGVFQHHLEMPRYGLLARHGHEWDVWNFEHYRDDAVAGSYQPDDYKLTPIGDPITTELVARLPFELRRQLAETNEFHDTPELDDIYRRLQRVEDVRPLTASFRWIFYQAGRLHDGLAPSQADALRRTLREVLRGIAADFRALPYWQRWHETHHELFHMDAANKLQLVLSLIERFDIERVADLVDKYQSLLERAEGEGEDPCRTGAARESLDGMGDGPRFVVYGHTHEPLQTALRADPAPELYLNSGTWRRRQFLTEDKVGFVDWELFTYLVFVDRNETQDGRDRGGPAFINWSGTRRL